MIVIFAQQMKLKWSEDDKTAVDRGLIESPVINHEKGMLTLTKSKMR